MDVSSKVNQIVIDYDDEEHKTTINLFKRSLMADSKSDDPTESV